jgi:hypothetical protein
MSEPENSMNIDDDEIAEEVEGLNPTQYQAD